MPTTLEGGFHQFVVSTWNATFAPKGLPPKVLVKLNDALNKALDDQATRKQLIDIGFVISDVARESPETLREFVATEVPRWAKSRDKVKPGRSRL